MEPGKGIALLRNRSSGTIARNDFSLDSGYETKFLHEYGDITGINSQLWLSVIIILFTLTRSIVITTNTKARYERQYNYWTKNSLPCIVVLYNPDDDMCIWEKLTSETIQRTNGGKGNGFFVKVPMNQVFLSESSSQKLLSFTNLPQHITNYNFLLSQKKFMQIIQSGGEVKLHSTEWVNKSSGKGDTELIVNDGKSVQKYSYPYWFPFTPYTEVFPRLFPWAIFSADEEFFEENDMNLWREYHCYYDKEDGEWLVVGDTFEEFRKKLSPMRSIDHAGEVAEYMMILSLNELGKAFLNVDKFVSQNQPYASTRPNAE